jgi:hypothetical protein
MGEKQFPLLTPSWRLLEVAACRTLKVEGVVALLSYLFYDTNFLTKQCEFSKGGVCSQNLHSTSLLLASISGKMRKEHRVVVGRFILKIASQGVLKEKK